MRKQNDSRIYTMLRRVLVILVIVAIACTAIVSYCVSVQYALETARNNDHQLLSMHSSMMSTMKELAFRIGRQAYDDNRISSLMYGSNHSMQDKYLALLQLNNYRSSLPYIESIYVYNGKSNMLTISSRHSGDMDVSVSEGAVDPIVTQVLKTATHSDILSPYPHMIQYNESYKVDTFCYTFVISETYGSEPIRHAVFINFSAGWMQQILKENKDSQSETLMIDTDGMIVFSTREEHIFQSLSDTDLLRVIQENNGNSQHAISQIDGRRMILTMLPRDDSGWYYVRTTPYQVVMEDSVRAVRLMLLIDFGLVLGYVVLALIASKRIYIPIDSISRQLIDVRDEKQELENTNRQKRMLRKLLLDVACSEQYEALVNEVKMTDATMSESMQYCVLVVRIDKYNRFCNAYPLQERAERMQRLIRISMDVLSARFQIRTLELGEGSNIVFVLMCEDKSEFTREEWVHRIDEMRVRIDAEINVKFSCAVSPMGDSVSDLSSLYHQAYNSIRYRIFIGGGSTIFAQDIQAYDEKSYVYPEDKETQMIASLMNGDSEQAKALATDILRGITTYPFIAIHLTISRMTMALLLAIRKTEFGGFSFPPELREMLMTAASLDGVDSFDTTVHLFCSAIDKLTTCLSDKRDSRHEELVAYINDLIDQSYGNPDCSLSAIAQRVNLSSSYIARLYRSYMLSSIPDRINSVRMEKARNMLLEDPKMSITEISQRVGFSSSSYFCKNFRKENGVTPNVYRSSNSQEER